MKPVLQHDPGNEFLNSQMLPPQARGANFEALYFRQLQLVTNQIHETVNIDQLMLEVSKDICQLFNADRLTLYALNEDGSGIVSKVKTGLNTSQELKLPVSPKSIAGFVALDQKMVNISDVYDEAHLKRIHPQLSFLQAVDVLSGYLTKQMLVAPITNGGTLYGVLQVINNRSGQPFSKLDEDGAQYLCKTLGIAMRQRLQKAPVEQRQKTTKYDSLLTDGVLTSEDLAKCIQQARDMSQPVEHLLTAIYHVRASQIGEALSKFFRVPYKPFSSARIRSEMLQGTLKREFVEQQGWIPLEESPDGLVIMCRDPEAIRGARVVPQVFSRTEKFVYCVTTQNEFEETLIQLFGAGHEGSTIDQLLADMDSPLESDSFEDPLLESAAAGNELVKFVNKVIVDAFNMKVSDIHIEPMPGKAKTGIRFRIDGSLQPYIEVPAQFRQAMVTRLKIMCDLDISERRKPQDGKIKFKKFGPLDIELRVATIPSAGGVEDVVLRLLGTGEPLPLEKLGLTTHNLERLKKTVTKPYGLFYVCGPTGSGKTTTLHSILKYLNTPNTKIWTAEDPVEITQKGLRQVQINKKAGVDFAAIMRAFLRADPDIIMVGESRDKETVSMGVEASLTGHLVFSTLHTNSAPESIIRLLDMGMDPFNFADALLGILAQRLAKKLCVCKAAYFPDKAERNTFVAEYVEELRATSDWKSDPDSEIKKLESRWLEHYGENGQLKMYRPVGCQKCNNTGYKGRIGLHELMIADDASKKLIQERARGAELFASAVNSGMRTLKMDGMEKILMGLTDLKMVRSVCIK